MSVRQLSKLGILGLLFVSFTVNAQEMNKPAPACNIEPFQGGNAGSIQQFKGKVVYVDFWASWCSSCAESFPFLDMLQEQYQSQGLHIVAINMDENIEDAKDFLAKFSPKFMVVTNKDQQCAINFAVEAMPSSYLIDKKGNIRYAHIGFRAGETEELKKKVEQLLSEN